MFDAKTGDSLVTFSGHAEPVFGVAIAPDGITAITSGRDKSLRRWNIADAKEIQRIAGFGDDVLHVAITKDGRIFSCSADRTARSHALAGGKLLKTFTGHADWVYSLAFCPTTDRLATGSFDGEVRVWNVADGKGLVKFLAAPGYKKHQTRLAARSPKAKGEGAPLRRAIDPEKVSPVAGEKSLPGSLRPAPLSSTGWTDIVEGAAPENGHTPIGEMRVPR